MIRVDAVALQTIVGHALFSLVLPFSLCVVKRGIHLVRTHERGAPGREVEQKRTPCVQGGGGFTHLIAYAKVSLFCTYSVMFSYASYFYHTLLSFASTFITFITFHDFRYKTFRMIIFLSLKCFSFCPYGIVFTILVRT